MIVDTSVIVAIMLEETEATDFATRIASALRCRLSAGSWIELTAVFVRGYPNIAEADVDRFMEKMRIEIAPVTLEQARIGEMAYRDYGRGTRHPAQLNFGDCFAYALAKATGEPLLFKGEDFSKTDVTPAR